MINLEFTGERAVPKKMDSNNPTLLAHLQRYRFAQKYCENKTVLDAACGAGYGSLMLNSVAKSVDGIDNDKETIEYAKYHYPGPTYKLYDLEHSFPNIEYDVIVSFETIEHLKNPFYFLRCVKQYCKVFIFSIPVNFPYKFHKQTYSLEAAKKLIHSYLGLDVKWFRQTKAQIVPETSGFPYLIGVYKKLE